MPVTRCGNRSPSSLQPACDDMRKNAPMLSQLGRISSREWRSGNWTVTEESEQIMSLRTISMSSRASAGSLYLVTVLATRVRPPFRDGEAR